MHYKTTKSVNIDRLCCLNMYLVYKVQQFVDPINQRVSQQIVSYIT
jgi:hypothetical protein